jgi:hypothetical protein
MDSDGEDRPESIPSLINELQKGELHIEKVPALAPRCGRGTGNRETFVARGGGPGG